MKNPTASSVEAAWQWISPSLRMAELFYSKNGIPIDEDLDFDYDIRYEIVRVEKDQVSNMLSHTIEQFVYI